MDQVDTETKGDTEAFDEAGHSLNQNKPMTLADIEFQASDEHSQDLFNDNESSIQNSPCINFDVSEITRVNYSPLVADLQSTLTQTPKIGKEERNSGQATVPSIPTSLVPFISNVNESWNSELETPQAKTADETNQLHVYSSGQLLKSCETMERRGCGLMMSNGVIPEVKTPSGCFVARFENERLSTSPILNTIIKRRRPKRRILKSLDTTVPTDSLKEVPNISLASFTDDNFIKGMGNFRSEETGGSEDNETSLLNKTNIVSNTTFIIDEDCSAHNSNIDIMQDEIYGKESNLPTDIQFMGDNVQDSILVANLSSEVNGLDKEECLMNTRLRSCEDLGETDPSDTLKNEEGVLRSSDGGKKVFMDSPDTELHVNEPERKSVAERMKEIRELQEERVLVSEFKQAEIPIEVFTRDAKALEKAEMTAMSPANNKSNVRRQWGLISFTQMCLLEQENFENEESGANETGNTDSMNKKPIFSDNVEKDDPNIAKPVALCPEGNDADIVDIFASSFGEEEKEEGMIGSEEFSPWFYQSNEASFKESQAGTRKEISVSEGIKTAVKVTDNYLKNCPSNFTTSETKIKNHAKLCIEGNGLNDCKKTLPKDITDGNYRVENKEETLKNPLHSGGSIGFFTASGKPITVSEDKMRKAIKLYNEIAVQDRDCKILYEMPGDDGTNNKENKAIIDRDSDSLIGFSTASGNTIKINGHKLKEAEKLYDEINLVDNSLLSLAPLPRGVKRRHEFYSTDSYQVCGAQSTMGFTTASGKPLVISETAMKKAKMMYQSEDILEGQLPEYNEATKELSNSKDIKSSSSFSFLTASSTHEKIKESASILKDRNISNDKDTYKLRRSSRGTCDGMILISSMEQNISDSLPKAILSDSETRSNKILPGFCTASGKALAINKAALERAKKLLDDSSDYPDTSQVLMGMGYAGNKILYTEDKVPNSTRNRAAINDNLIDELRQTDNPRNQASNSFGNSNATTMSVSTGFNTASGKSIKISDQALSTARTLLQEEQDNCTSSLSIFKTGDKDPFVGFSTANGERIMISDQALLSAKVLLAEEDDSYKATDTLAFSAAGGKATKISDNGLAKAKMFFATEQENTPPYNRSMKRNNTHLETPGNNNFPASVTPAFKSAENTLSEDTPMGESIFQTSKRVRFNPDLQARKLFDGNSCDTDEEMENGDKFDIENKKNPRTPLNSNSNHSHHLLNRDETRNVSFIENRTAGMYANSEMFEINDRLMCPKLKPQKSWPGNAEVSGEFNEDAVCLPQRKKDRRISTYSDEITASTEALLADEENSINGKSWASAITCSPTVMDDREISVKAITLGEKCDIIQEVPTSPIIGAKFRPRRKNKRNKRNILKKDVINLVSTKDNRCGMSSCLEEQFVTQDSQQSSRATTPTSDSSKSSHRNTSPIIETALVSKIEKCEETSKTIQSFDDQSENLLELISSEMEDREAIDNSLENRIAATLEQEKHIHAKKKCKPKPIIGSLLLRRSENKESRISWRVATNGVPPKPRTSCELKKLGIKPEVMEITAATALSYKFECSDFWRRDEIHTNIHGLDMGDGGRLISDENGLAGATEFRQAFMASPGVDPTLIPQRWVENHYRWIVWKLASMDRMKFGDLSMPRMLTPHHVMQQLKYRYDREIDKSQRPALRRIIEKDDPASRCIILCVASIAKLESNESLEKGPRMTPTSYWKVELTDGWYSITATIDSAMAHLIAFGKVREGTKLVTCSAELLNCDQGCSPLEIPADVSLKIHTNSTRRSKWDSKLGYCRYAGPIPTSLSAILPNGGLIGKLNTIIARVYPIQYYEKTCNGQSIFRNTKCEDKAVMVYEKERQAQIDKIYAQARAEFEARSQRTSSSDKQQPRFESHCETLEAAFRNELESILRRSLPPPRKVTPLLKVRVTEGDNLAVVSIWAPSEDIIEVLKEGNRVSIHNVQTYNGKRSGELQLTAGHQSFVKLEGSDVSSFSRRCVTSIPEVAVPGFNPPFCELDTVGMVVSLGPAPHGMKNFEVVNLAYPNSDLKGSAYLSILFWEGIEAYGFSDILSVGSTVACTNLQWRRGAPRTVPMVYSTEHSTFTRNPRQAYLRSDFDSVKNRIKDPVTYALQCAAEIAIEHQKKSTVFHSPGVTQGTPSKAPPSGALIQDKFIPGLSPRTPQGVQNPAGNTPAKYSIQRRLEKLQWYGEPPDLSPVALNHSSNKVKQKFVPPARTPEHL